MLSSSATFSCRLTIANSRSDTMRISSVLSVLAVVTACSVRPEPLAKQQGASQQYDVVITNGKIVDGTGNPWFYGDVAISGDHIARIAPAGTLTESAKQKIDAHG